MSRNQIRVSASPHAVFDVLDDASAYRRWVVGARQVRRVDQPRGPEHIALEVRFRPTGVARVDLSVVADGMGALVTIDESPTSGPAARLPRVIVDPLLKARNVVSLQRLRHEVEHQAQRAEPSVAPTHR